jgi:hypothetical protein
LAKSWPRLVILLSAQAGRKLILGNRAGQAKHESVDPCNSMKCR